MKLKKNGFYWLGILLINSMPAFAEPLANPCYSGDNQLLNIIDRPTVGYSACVAPQGKFITEMGYQYQTIGENLGSLQNYPQAELRLGLGKETEFTALIPSYNIQSAISPSGFAQTTFALKHILGYSKNLVVTAQALFPLPSGSVLYGDKGLGVVVNSIVSYTPSSQINFTFMLGGGSFTDPIISGGNRYTSINPNFVISYAPQTNTSLYLEFFGETKTSFNQGSGINADVGILYLIQPNIILDLEYAKSFTGLLGGYDHYLGAGITFMV